MRASDLSPSLSANLGLAAPTLTVPYFRAVDFDRTDVRLWYTSGWLGHNDRGSWLGARQNLVLLHGRKLDARWVPWVLRNRAVQDKHCA